MELDPACSCTSSMQASATECTKDQPQSSMQRVTVHTGGQMSGTRPSVQLYILQAGFSHRMYQGPASEQHAESDCTHRRTDEWN